MATPGYVKLLEGTRLPRMAPIRQHFEAIEAGDPTEAVRKAMQESDCAAKIRPGMSVAITVGSRGIAALDQLVKAIVLELRKAGAEPFIVPAMGSHGGATAEGQVKVLSKLGVTEESAGCPIRSSMDTVEVGRLENGMPVVIDRLAHEADGIVLFNRIKPHTSFRYSNESGLIKMLSIGLGKQSGADNCHAWGIDWVGQIIVDMARVKLERSSILFGIGTIENAYDRLSEVVVLPPEGMIEAERPLLQKAMRNLPRLPLGPLDAPLASGPLDVLVVDEIGKEYAGTGMDPNITGRASSDALTGGPDITRIAVLDVSERSGGNANGVARADVITDRLFDAFDREAVYANCLTSNMLSSGALPVSMPDDRSAIMAAVKTCGARDPDRITMLRIPNSLHLEYMLASETLLDELSSRHGVDILGEPQEMAFDANGNLDHRMWETLHR
ncbi:lactate racemase domain-containing protein [Notoacmeibacter sp. MSK16QG-6]|uniref:lactate racemase domain-containing protein n=1 Tax=Notoacmeibacter sp. MSK16QG-6 TaxID=2957982 RepID=UPI0020A0D190|nr:lactate racemase domain-containing protein [Notoacmeibacter sp. MSK16QG-6]MCP1199567.1 nickel-dependent lactate racemase [Notoacmeibacter sp. MSK16QG-6]